MTILHDLSTVRKTPPSLHATQRNIAALIVAGRATDALLTEWAATLFAEPTGWGPTLAPWEGVE